MEPGFSFRAEYEEQFIEYTVEGGRQSVSGITIMVRAVNSVFGGTSPSDLFRIQLMQYNW